MSFFQKVYSFCDSGISFTAAMYITFLTAVSFTFWLSVVSGTKIFIISFRDPLHLHRYRPLLMHQLDLFFSFHLCCWANSSLGIQHLFIIVRIRIHSYHGNQLLRLPRSIQISAFLVLYSKCSANKYSAQYVRFYLIRHYKLLYKDVYCTLCTELFRRFSPNISQICSNLR